MGLFTILFVFLSVASSPQAVFALPTAGLVFSQTGDHFKAVGALVALWPAFALGSIPLAAPDRWLAPPSFTDWAFGRPQHEDGARWAVSCTAVSFWLSCIRSVPAGYVCGSLQPYLARDNAMLAVRMMNMLGA